MKVDLPRSGPYVFLLPSDTFCDVESAVSPCRMLGTASMLSSETKVMRIRSIAMTYFTAVTLRVSVRLLLKVSTEELT